MKSVTIKGPSGDLVIYRTKDGRNQVDVRLERESLWLDAHQMAKVFERDRTVIVRHIRNIYGTKELNKASTCAKSAQVAADGKVRQMDLYNLDMVLAVGYRVNSRRGTEFRIWATQILRDHLVAGYTLNEKRLIVHYHKIVVALFETIRLMSDIDTVIAAHGGWPGAFAAREVTK